MGQKYKKYKHKYYQLKYGGVGITPEQQIKLDEEYQNHIEFNPDIPLPTKQYSVTTMDGSRVTVDVKYPYEVLDLKIAIILQNRDETINNYSIFIQDHGEDQVPDYIQLNDNDNENGIFLMQMDNTVPLKEWLHSLHNLSGNPSRVITMDEDLIDITADILEQLNISTLSEIWNSFSDSETKETIDNAIKYGVCDYINNNIQRLMDDELIRETYNNIFNDDFDTNISFKRLFICRSVLKRKETTLRPIVLFTLEATKDILLTYPYYISLISEPGRNNTWNQEYAYFELGNEEEITNKKLELAYNSEIFQLKRDKPYFGPPPRLHRSYAAYNPAIPEKFSEVRITHYSPDQIIRTIEGMDRPYYPEGYPRQITDGISTSHDDDLPSFSSDSSNVTYDSPRFQSKFDDADY